MKCGRVLTTAIMLVFAGGITADLTETDDSNMERKIIKPYEELPDCNNFPTLYGDDSRLPNMDVAFPEWYDHYILVNRLCAHYNEGVYDYGPDHMTVRFSQTEGGPLYYGYSECAMSWFVSNYDVAGKTEQIDRYQCPANFKHRDSRNDLTAGSASCTFTYHHKDTLGHPWTTSTNGTEQLQELLLCQPPIDYYDYKTGFSSECGEADYLCLSSMNGLYGFPRWGNDPRGSEVLAAAFDKYVLNNGTLDVRVNEIWGGGIGQIWHIPSGRQVVMEHIGGMIQGTIWYGGLFRDGASLYYNPNQSGGVDWVNDGNTRRWVGSPIFDVEYEPSSTPPRYKTKVRPFNYFNNVASGLGALPMLWRGTMQFEVKAGYAENDHIYPNVLEITFGAKHDTAEESPDGQTPVPERTDIYGLFKTAWLNSCSVGDGNTNTYSLWLLDLHYGTSEQIDLPSSWGVRTSQSQVTNKALILQGESPASLQFGLMYIGTASLHMTKHCGGIYPPVITCPLGNQRAAMQASKFHWLNAGDTEYTADTVFLYIGYTFESIEHTLSQIYCDRTGDCADNCLLNSYVFEDNFESGDTSRWSETIVE